MTTGGILSRGGSHSGCPSSPDGRRRNGCRGRSKN